MSVHPKLHQYFVPSHHNAYRPHILRQQLLLFFVAAILLSEGVFVSGAFVRESPTIAYTQVETNLAAAASTPTFFDTLGRQLARMAVDAQPFVPWVLGLIAVIVTIGVFLAFMIHIEIQQSEMLFSGIMVALFAFSLMVTDIQVLGML